VSDWRPPSIIRPIAIGLVLRGEDLLLMAVRDGGDAIKGWRPLGGTIEFGERAADALKREFHEELGLAIVEPTLLSVMENLYTHNGAVGHEIVLVFETSLVDVAQYSRGTFSFGDDGNRNEVKWVALSRFVRREAVLFPVGLVDLLMQVR
jgi:ADP-ribose pyrophosphatase YjhB (NUDIX family)